MEIQDKKTDLLETVFNVKNKEEKRDLLKNLSATAKLMMVANPEEWENVNEIILEFYRGGEHQEFDTYNGWKERGFKVKKGSKAFFIWSKPQKIKKSKENETEIKKGSDEEKTIKMYGIANLFSNFQVEKSYFRKCDVTGEGMNEGFVFNDGVFYAKHEKDALNYAIKNGFKTLDESFKNGFHYYTEWEE